MKKKRIISPSQNLKLLLCQITAKIKRKVTNWENMSVNYISDKGLTSRIYKKLSKRNDKEIRPKDLSKDDIKMAYASILYST